MDEYDALENQRLADMRIEIAKMILSLARLGQVTALKEMAQAYLAERAALHHGDDDEA
jgi:hypothetical protein